MKKPLNFKIQMPQFLSSDNVYKDKIQHIDKVLVINKF